jgi:opacity protein-like surface antigen
MNGKQLLALFVLILIPAPATSQSATPQEPVWKSRPKVEIIASVAVAHVFRFEDRGYGTKVNAGAGIEVPIWRGLRAGAEVNTTFGLSPGVVACGGIYPSPGQPAYPCTGFARDGVGAATEASFTAGYFFGNHRLQPYVLGGVSLLRTEQYSAAYLVRSDHIELLETATNTTGVGMTLGAGLRIAVTRHLSIRPEFRYSDGTGLSNANLSQTRLSLGMGYSW